MKEIPMTVKRSIELLGLFLVGALLVLGSNIIMPLIMAFFISIVLLPPYRFFRKKRFPNVLAILLPILIMLTVVAAIGWFFSAQAARLIADFPQIQKNVSLHLNSLSRWIDQISHFSPTEQIKFVNEQSAKLLNYAAALLGGAAGSVSSAFIFMGLLPIYVFLMLNYKNLLLRFIFMWFPAEQHDKVEEVLSESESIIKSYLIGLLIQVTYMTVFLGGILLLFGIKHALLIGVLFALLNLIPYIGALIGNILGVLLTLSSSQSLTPVLIVLCTIAFVQFLDNNILMPRIVGSKVRINALGAIVGVLVGGAIAGISGMFLSLPVIAVIKIIFDRSEMFKPWGVLLGDENPNESPMRKRMLRSKSDLVREKLEAENDIETTDKSEEVQERKDP
ncbi:AI-2E family transporter [Pararcticibacter amylolyticus]|uniref:AI-2E family transporter n=1 Tax=Pararcticibacter amylolyticus TaxID=2173175 RepID=A0A2U2PFQ2_9SPHI|nr:AI-2E family transporter [Pararcticibacter amylolyticus]PWG80154.1 AI-2E family transporter [Pararcticibacter amylolyticus]